MLLNQYLEISNEVRDALAANEPVVALETTIVSHGMPYPRNLEVARHGIELLRKKGVVPALIAVLGGRIIAGLDDDELSYLARAEDVRKISRRDFAMAVVDKADGATTVAATMIVAAAAGIEVFATGGIGGVHRGAGTSFDVSADLIEFSRTPIVVVSAGAKAILDLPATVEYLETFGVPVVGYRTDVFPAFYSRESVVPVLKRSDDPDTIARYYRTQRTLGFEQSVLVANPIPSQDEIPRETIEKHIELAMVELDEKGITGKAVTPFLLRHIVDSTGGKSLDANISLFNNNLSLAADIARALCYI